MEKQMAVNEDTQPASLFLQPRSQIDEMVPLSITVGLSSSTPENSSQIWRESIPHCNSSACQVNIQYKQITESKSWALSLLMQEAFLFMLGWVGLEETWHGKLFTADGRQNGEIPYLFSLLPRKVIGLQHMEKNHQKIPHSISIWPNLLHSKLVWNFSLKVNKCFCLVSFSSLLHNCQMLAVCI